MLSKHFRLLLGALAMSVLPFAALPTYAAPLSGAIFTTDSTCSGVDLNIYSSKDAVYLNGGPAHPGAAGLPDGSYYVQVTTPSGAQLGASSGAAVTVSGGIFADCYQLSSILLKTSDGTPGYDDTTNDGGEYKVWVSTGPLFEASSSKTDNFKVDAIIDESTPPRLLVVKFYDANANGTKDPGEDFLLNWKVHIVDGIDNFRFTPVDMTVAPDTYTVSELPPNEPNWYPTTPTSVEVVLAANDVKTVTFGNVCLGAGGGLTLGFWSNRNGQAQFVVGDDLAQMVLLNLRNANGTAFDPAGYTAFRTWLLGASATNMAYMLSAQLAAMKLNVINGNVSGTAIIYAPGTTSANAFGFAAVDAIIAEANASLGSSGLTLSGNPERAHQEALKTALDKANNNLSFVQGTPCAYSFAD